MEKTFELEGVRGIFSFSVKYTWVMDIPDNAAEKFADTFERRDHHKVWYVLDEPKDSSPGMKGLYAMEKIL